MRVRAWAQGLGFLRQPSTGEEPEPSNGGTGSPQARMGRGQEAGPAFPGLRKQLGGQQSPTYV